MTDRVVERFRSHANYLRAFAMLCSVPYAGTGRPRLAAPLDQVLAQLASGVSTSPSLTPPLKAAADLAQAQASLNNAWGTELLLAFGAEVATDEDLVRLMNNWAVVQAYYASYHAIQALLVTRGYPRPESHSKTQRLFADFWTRPGVNVPPWSFAARDGGWCNPPLHSIDDGISPWKGCDPISCWDLAAKAMRTTREAKVKESKARARERKRTENRRSWAREESIRVVAGKRPRKQPDFGLPRLAADEHRRVAARVGPSTLLDYLYRLRLKANYEDASMFIEGPEDDQASGVVNRQLVSVASCTLLAHELHVGAVTGKRELMGWVDQWLGRNRAGSALGLGLRRDLLRSQL